ncbi:arginase family protein [Amycolatopsis anabasis]|uniref:arginase family protein n=1 Tax=Amycolatopsis anabasis TaxID=1840409 RepID=UPI00131DCFCA|nr:arginase family protein [Amycolatopsis anabasis]
MTGIDLITVPYDSGVRGRWMGAGPDELLDRGVEDRIGPDVRTRIVDIGEDLPEIRSAARLHREVAELVRGGGPPFLLAGNCNTTVGLVAGITGRTDDLGVVWFDAHGDFNTPESSPSGFFDGMALAMLTGGCWRPLTAAVPGFRPVPEANVVLAGARDLDEGERALIEASELHVVPPGEVHADGLTAALRRLPPTVTRIHLHVDLDVHDLDTVGRANAYAAGGGPDARQVRNAVAAVAEAYPIAGATLSAYNPFADSGSGIQDAALDLAEQIGGFLRRALD